MPSYQQAFPVPCVPGEHDYSPGIDMRDYFAAQALVGFMSGDMVGSLATGAKEAGVTNTAFLATAAYEVADAMLKAREAKP